MAETGIAAIDDDVRSATGFGAGSEFADAEDLKELRERVSIRDHKFVW